MKERKQNLKPDLLERTFEFARQIVRLCKELEAEEGVSRWFCYQLFKAGTSVGANYEESKAVQSRADFVTKLYIVRKEARESHFWLRLLAAEEIVPPSRLAWLLGEANELVAIFTSSTKTIKQENE